MKKVSEILFKILFAVVFPISLISTSLDPRFNHILFGYFGQHGQSFTYIRYAVICAVLFLLVFLNRQEPHFLGRTIAISLGAVTFAILYESIFSHHWLYNYAYVLWSCAAVAVASGAVFVSATLFVRIDYDRLFKSFWLSFTVIYIYILYIAFIRSPGSYKMTVNLTPGQGTLHFFKYIVNGNRDALYISLVCFGNILIFLPLPFVIYNLFRKIPVSLLLLIGFMLPIGVETYQYFLKCGNVDIDDLLLNWLGGLIGIFLLKLIIKHKIILPKENNTPVSP